MRRLLLVPLLLLVAAPGTAEAARFSLGIHKGADPNAVARQVEAVSGHPVTRIGSFALSVRARHAGALGSVKGVSWVEREHPSRRLSFTPNDPLAARQWYLSRIHAFDSWPQFPALEPVRVAILDSGVDSTHPELQDQIVEGRSLRRQLLGQRHERPRHVRRRRDRSSAEQRPGHRGRRLPGRAPDRQDRALGRDDLARRRSSRDPLGGRSRRSRHQHELRRRSRPARSEPGHVFAPRGRGRPVRGRPGRARRGGGRERGRRAGRAVGLRRLSGSAAARPRRQLDRARRDRADLLEPRRPLQRHRCARRGDPLHAAPCADRERATRLPPSGVLGLRADRVPPRRGHVVLGAARLGRSRAPLRVVPVAAGRPGLEPPHALGRGCECRHGLHSVPGRPRRDDRLGPARHRERPGCSRQPAPGGGSLRGERPGRERRLAVGAQGPADPRHDRLLGRPSGRLQGPLARWAADRREAPRPSRARTRTSSSGSRARRPFAPQSPTAASSPASRRLRAPGKRSA